MLKNVFLPASMTKRNLHLLFFLFLITGTRICYGQNITSIRFQTLGINEGLSQSSVFDVIQDQDGFIWVGTQDGLNRYDGTSFQTYYKDQKDTTTLESNTINCFYNDFENQYLWIGTERGLSVFDHKTGDFKPNFLPTLKGKEISQIKGDDLGNIWINVREKGLYNYSNKNLTLAIEKTILGFNLLNKNTLIAGGRATGFEIDLTTKKTTKNTNYKGLLNILSTNKAHYFLYTDAIIEQKFSGEKTNLIELDKTLSSDLLSTMLITNDNYLWLGTNKSGLYLIDLEKKLINNFHQDDKTHYGISDNNIRSIYEDETGVIWIGTDNNGLSFFDFSKQNIKYIDAKTSNSQGLSSKIIWAIEGIDDGKILIGTDKGLDCFDQFSGEVYNFNIANIKNKDVRKIHYSENALLIGTDFGLFKADIYGKQAYFKNLFTSAVFNNVKVFDIDYIGENEYWIGTDKGLILFNIKTLEHTFYNKINSNISDQNILVVFKSGESWWVGTDRGLNLLINYTQDKAKFKVFLPSNRGNSISGSIITSIVEDESKNLWIGTYDGGLNKKTNNNNFINYTVQDGLSNNAIYGILLLDSSLWMSTNRGVSSYNMRTNNFRNFYESDGLQSNEFNIGAFYQSKYGELFFGGVNGLSHFFPSDLKKNAKAPKAAITDITINNKPIHELPEYSNVGLSGLSKIKLGYTQNNISFQLAALHFSNPANNAYRYYIKELQDSSTVLPTSNHIANYTALSPGTYHLVVYVSNADNVWSKKPLTLTIIINPPFWASWWFRTIIGAILLLIILTSIRFRIKNIKKQKSKLETLVKKRTATIFDQKEQIEEQKLAIEKEKVKADEVLSKIFPDRIAKRLKDKGKVKAEYYPEATIMFADIVQFSTIAKEISAEKLVEKLNLYFKEFDKIIVRNNVIQIKTIGDAYMTVAGIPSNKTNAIDTVLTGLQIQAYMKNMLDIDPATWKVRIGINTGKIVAGVLDTKRPLYDIWGSSVNIASRVQDEGEPGKVNISESTYHLIKPFFECEARGGILTKNVGVVSMYFVTGVKPILSLNGEGKVPSTRFWKYVNTYQESEVKYRELESDFLDYLKNNLDSSLYYHSVLHTMDVLEATENIALHEGVLDERMILLKTAALIHDAGFIKQYNNNEVIGVEIAKETLPKYGYTKNQIDKISALILATAVDHEPKNKLERIIKDADLDYLGRDDFEEISDKLYLELKEREIIKDKEHWDKLQIKFFEKHQYYTDYSQKHRAKKKQLNKPN